MLSEEEKKAINNLNFIVVTDIYDNEVSINKTEMVNEYNHSVGIVLNLITKLQKENEHWKNKFEKELEDNRKNSCELLKQDLVIREKNEQIDLKDKQIDLMSEFISKYHCFEVAVYDLDNECTHDHECKKCVKQYFETKAKKGE